jgi:hypothetical protein
MDKPLNPKSWRRRHVNGMDALVFEAPIRKGLYSAGAISGDSSSTLVVVRGSLIDAQRVADQMAGCEPCQCGPWV